MGKLASVKYKDHGARFAYREDVLAFNVIAVTVDISTPSPGYDNETEFDKESRRAAELAAFGHLLAEQYSGIKPGDGERNRKRRAALL